MGTYNGIGVLLARGATVRQGETAEPENGPHTSGSNGKVQF